MMLGRFSATKERPGTQKKVGSQKEKEGRRIRAEKESHQFRWSSPQQSSSFQIATTTTTTTTTTTPTLTNATTTNTTIATIAIIATNPLATTTCRQYNRRRRPHCSCSCFGCRGHIRRTTTTTTDHHHQRRPQHDPITNQHWSHWKH